MNKKKIKSVATKAAQAAVQPQLDVQQQFLAGYLGDTLGVKKKKIVPMVRMMGKRNDQRF
jgi:hypothetical protein